MRSHLSTNGMRSVALLATAVRRQPLVQWMCRALAVLGAFLLVSDSGLSANSSSSANSLLPNFASHAINPVGIWVGTTQSLRHLNPATHQFDQSIPITGAVQALAVDPNSGALWVLEGSHLSKFTVDAHLGLELDLRGVSADTSAAKFLKLDPYDGSVWVAGVREITHMNSDGTLVSSRKTLHDIQELELDVDQTLWVLTSNELQRLSVASDVLLSLPLEQEFPRGAMYFALDVPGKRVSVADRHRLLQFDLTNIAASPKHIDLELESVQTDVSSAGTKVDASAKRAASGTQALGVHPLFGTVWVLQAGHLFEYDRDLRLQNRIDIQSSSPGRPLSHFLVDPIQDSIWVEAHGAVLQFRGSGGHVASVNLDGDLTALGATAFRILPTVSLIAPVGDAIAHDSAGSIRYRLGADCNGAACFLDVDYLRTLTLNIELNNRPIGPLLDRSGPDATFTPTAPFLVGQNLLRAQATDRYNHISTLSESIFSVNSTPVNSANTTSGAQVQNATRTSSPNTTGVAVASSGTRVNPPVNTSGSATATPGSAGPSSDGVGTTTAIAEASSQNSVAHSAAIAENFGRMPLSFESNQGQTHSSVKFLTRGVGHTFFFTHAETVMSLANPKRMRKKLEPLASALEVARESSSSFVLPSDSSTLDDSEPDTAVLRMSLVGGQANALIEGLEPLVTRSNYLIGNDPSKWIKDVRHYAQLKYHDVYPGIDQLYYGKDGALEYDLIVRPGADPKQIELAFEGSTPLRLDAEGHLVLTTPLGEVTQRKPVIYQDIDGRRNYIDGRYVLHGTSKLGIEVGAYQHSQPLVIDPTIIYSTYLGGTGSQGANAIAVDAAGAVYVTGRVDSTDFPTVNPIPGSGTRSSSAFVSKLSADGATLIYSTYLSGTNNTASGYGIAVDSQGFAYITGQTDSTTFPTTTGVSQRSLSGPTDGFVSKLSQAGNALVYSTYLGGSSRELAYKIAVDSQSNAYVVGQSMSSNFPTTTNAYQKTLPTTCTVNKQFASVGFLTKLASNGTRNYSTYMCYGAYGGLYGVAVDTAGSAYATGYASPTVSSPVAPYQPCAVAGPDVAYVFVAKFTATPGSSLSYSRCVGPGSVAGIAVDAQGSAYIAGSNLAHIPFPTTSTAYQPTNQGNPNSANDSNAFVTKLNPAGTGLLYSTFFGGPNGAGAGAIALDSQNNVYIAGSVTLPTFPLRYPIPNMGGGGTFQNFVAKINPSDSNADHTLVYSTFLGNNASNATTYFLGIAADSSGNAYVTGQTSAKNFPVVHWLKGSATGQGDQAFITKLSPTNTLQTPTIDFNVSPDPPIKPTDAVLFYAALGGGSIIPTGTITFLDGTTSLGVAALSEDADVSFFSPQLSPGSHSITAVYSGDGVYAPVTSPPVSVTVVTAPVVNIVSPSSGASFPEPASFTLVAQATGNSALTTMQFYEGTTLLNTCSISAGSTSATCNYSLSGVLAGTHSYTVRATDSNNLSATSSAMSVTVTLAPNVSITSPVSGTSIPAPASFVLVAQATSSNAALSKLEFFESGTLLSTCSLGSLSSASCTSGLSAVPAGTHTYTVKATDVNGLNTTSSAVDVIVLPQPTVSLTTSSVLVNGQGSFQLSANASSGSGFVRKFEYYDGATLFYTFVVPGDLANVTNNLTLSNIAAGAHSYSVVVTDNQNVTATSSAVSVTVTASGAPPTVSVTASGASFPAPANFDLNVNASTSGGSIRKLELYDGTTFINSATLTSAASSVIFTFSLSGVAAGTHNYTVVATDDRSISATSNAASVAVSAPTNALSVNLTAPVDKSFLVAPALTTLQAITTGTNITSVEFFQNGVSIGSVTSPPYRIVWTNVPVGNYTVTARVTDSASATATSSPLTLTVLDNPIITVSSPINASTIDDDVVSISGVVQTRINSSIVANGVPGTIGPDGSFFVASVPLAQGTNTITVTVRTADGKSSSKTLTVTRGNQAPFVFKATPLSGVAPLAVSFALTDRGGVPYHHADIICADPGAVSLSVPAPTDLATTQNLGSCMYPAAGSVTVRVNVYDGAQNLLYTTNQQILIYSRVFMSAMLQGVYLGMLDQLKAGNILGALTNVTATVYDQYNAIFTDLINDPNLAATIEQQLKNIQDGVVADGYAELLVVTSDEGTPTGHLIYLIRGEDGIWRIDAM